MNARNGADGLTALRADGSGVPSDADFARLAAAEDASFWFRGRNRLLLATLHAEFPAARSFLEVGCGNGYVLAAVARARPGIDVAGSDLSDAGLAQARRRLPGALLLRADAHALAFDAEFDVAGAFDVLEHVADDGAVLRALRRAVRPGGGVLITVPQHRWLWSEADRYSGHQRRYQRRELAAKLRRAGLRLRWCSSFVTLLLPLMAASRAWQAISPRPYDPGRELHVAGRLDGLLESALALEARAIARGARLPAGGSLLAVAERPGMTILDHVPFNRPYYVEHEHERVLEAIAAVLLEIGPGDEVVMPSYTFSSTANAFALRGAVPVFVDIRSDTLNLDETLVEAAITARTRAIVPVHYAGVGCDMRALGAIADRHGLALVEDVAHTAMARHEGRPLGAFGQLGTLSFHETKNLTCGEGGALIISDPALVARAEVLRDKGTNRSAFLRGDVDRYTWVDIGSSYGMSDLNAMTDATCDRVIAAVHEALAELCSAATAAAAAGAPPEPVTSG